MTRETTPVSWRASSDARCPYEAIVDGERWQVRVNEFPEEPTPYSLLVAGEVVEELMAWPAAWTRPAEAPAAAATPPAPPAPDDPYDKREYELEQEKLARTRGIGPSKLVK